MIRRYGGISDAGRFLVSGTRLRRNCGIITLRSAAPIRGNMNENKRLETPSAEESSPTDSVPELEALAIFHSDWETVKTEVAERRERVPISPPPKMPVRRESNGGGRPAGIVASGDLSAVEERIAKLSKNLASKEHAPRKLKPRPKRQPKHRSAAKPAKQKVAQPVVTKCEPAAPRGITYQCHVKCIVCQDDPLSVRGGTCAACGLARA